MGSGGSRYGAGRPGWRQRCEHLLALDIRVLARRGHIPSESHITRYFPWRWSRGNEPAGSIRIQAERDQLRLTYSANNRPFDYPVWVERSPCHYGGSRPWFRCPRCLSRNAVLYGTASDGRFGCRHCMRLGYACESESRIDRINRRLHKLEAKLVEGQKPKWMRWRTFDRICEQLDAVDQMWGEEALVRFALLPVPYVPR